MPSPELQLVEPFEEVQHLLRSEEQVPWSMVEAYERIAQRLHVDFAATIRLLNVLPVFLHGTPHKIARKQMATGMAAVRANQEQAAQAFIAAFAQTLTPNQTTDWLATFTQPLWRTMQGMNSADHDALLDFIREVPRLFNLKTTLRERLAINDRIAQFIARDEAHADERLATLGQHILGTSPFVGSLTLSLHHVFQQHAGQLLSAIDYPPTYPSSAVLTTDRHVQSPPQVDATPQLNRCVLHSPQRTTEQNHALLYGMGEHVCLGRPLANTVWGMVTQQLACLPLRIRSSELTMAHAIPQSPDDYLKIVDPFQRPASLHVEMTSP